jgi:hypothetical protein
MLPRDMVRPGMLVTAITFALLFGLNRLAHWSWYNVGWLPTVILLYSGVIWLFLKIENHDRAMDGRAPYSWFDAGRDFKEAWPDMRFMLSMFVAFMAVFLYVKYLFFPSILGVPF